MARRVASIGPWCPFLVCGRLASEQQSGRDDRPGAQKALKAMTTVKLAQATITERMDLTHDLWIIKLRPDVPFTFKAGQYCTIGVDGVERPYSIVSAPDEPFIELFVELVPPPDGVLTPLLYEMGPGTTMSLRPRAKGLFTLDEKYRHHLMVATVTGICPYISILRQYLLQGRDDGHQFYVLQGGSYQDELGYQQELEDLAREHDFIHYVPTVSRPQEEWNAGWEGETGRVNTLIEKYVEEFRLDPDDAIIYLCGHPGMIEDGKVRAERLGFPFKEERFWKEDE